MNITFNKYNQIYGIDYYKCPYYVLYYYSDNLVYVKDENDKKFYIDVNNRKLNIFTYGNLVFENNGAIVNVFDNKSSCKMAVINKNAEYIIEPSRWHIAKTKTGYVVLDEGKRLNFYDFEGNLLNSLPSCFISDDDLYDSLLISGIGEIRKNSLSGLVNSRGEIVQPIKNKYIFEIWPYSNFIKSQDNNLSSVYHVYDSKGAFIGSFNTKLNRKKHIYINEKTKKLEKKYYKIESDFTPLALVSRNGKYGYIDKDYNIRIPIKYKNASRFINGLACVDDKIINVKGETVYDLKKHIVNLNEYEDKPVWEVVGNLFMLKLSYNSVDNKYLVFQTKQKIDQYFKVYNQEYNYIYFKLNGKWGIMDFDCNVILDAEYTCCNFLLDDKLFRVKLDNGEEYIINQQKDKILNSKSYVSVLGDNMILFKEDDFKGVMDFSGNIIIDPIFKKIIYSNGKFILDGKILKSIPKRNSNYYHVSYNLDITIDDDETITKTFSSNEFRQEYIEKLKNELKSVKNQYKDNFKILNAKYKKQKTEIIEGKVYQKKLNNGGVV